MSRITLADPDKLPEFLADLHEAAPDHDWPTKHVARAFSQNPQLLELMMMAGQYIGFGRMLAILQLEEVSCPI